MPLQYARRTCKAVKHDLSELTNSQENDSEVSFRREIIQVREELERAQRAIKELDYSAVKRSRDALAVAAFSFSNKNRNGPMKKLLEISLGIVTGVGGFLEVGSLATGQGANFGALVDQFNQQLGAGNYAAALATAKRVESFVRRHGTARCAQWQSAAGNKDCSGWSLHTVPSMRRLFHSLLADDAANLRNVSWRLLLSIGFDRTGRSRKLPFSPVSPYPVRKANGTPRWLSTSATG